MRFPIDPPQSLTVNVDRFEIRQAEAVRPVRAVNTGEVATQTEQGHRPDLSQSPQRVAQIVERNAAERRLTDRRQVNLHVFVDTRSGRDRRQLRRRAEDPHPASIQIRV